ncbi:MAG: glycosyltransferase [Oligoflexia bacterium]|nr:glycosyltransferase [Oligoflexia bacterium]
MRTLKSKKKKIFIITPSLSPCGGAEKIALNYFHRLNMEDSNFDCLLFSCFPSVDGISIDPNDIKFTSKIKQLYTNYYLLIDWIKKTKKKIKDQLKITTVNRYDKNKIEVDYRNIKSNIEFNESTTFKLLCYIKSFFIIPYLIFKQPHIIHIHTQHCLSFITISKIFKIKKILLTIHCELERLDKHSKKRLIKILKFVDIFYAVNSKIAKDIQEIIIQHGYKTTTVLLHNLIELSSDNLPSSLNMNGIGNNLKNTTSTIISSISSTTTLYIGTVTKYGKVKGLIFLIDAISIAVNNKIPVKLIIAGEEEQDNYFLSEIKRLNIRENVFFFGKYNSQKELLNFTSKYDVFCLPSLSESFSISLLEAISFAKPAIITDLLGPKEMVTNEYNGFIVPKGNAIEIAKKFEYFHRNRDSLVRMGENAKQLYKKKFNNDEIFKQYKSTLF